LAVLIRLGVFFPLRAHQCFWRVFPNSVASFLNAFLKIFQRT